MMRGDEIDDEMLLAESDVQSPFDLV
jgi:hypothetical protein